MLLLDEVEGMAAINGLRKTAVLVRKLRVAMFEIRAPRCFLRRLSFDNRISVFPKETIE